jgi:hypothetical protein
MRGGLPGAGQRGSHCGAADPHHPRQARRRIEFSVATGARGAEALIGRTDAGASIAADSDRTAGPELKQTQLHHRAITLALRSSAW